jgi:hypothetical protein
MIPVLGEFAFTSTATSSHPLPPTLAVQLQVTEPGDDLIVELDAPVIVKDDTCVSHLCVQVGEPSVEPPKIDAESKTQLSEYAVVIDIVGLPAL